MLGLCLYVPVSNSDKIEVDIFESKGLPSELKSVFNKLSVFLPSQEFSTYQKWRQVRGSTTFFKPTMLKHLPWFCNLLSPTSFKIPLS